MAESYASIRIGFQMPMDGNAGPQSQLQREAHFIKFFCMYLKCIAKVILDLLWSYDGPTKEQDFFVKKILTDTLKVMLANCQTLNKSDRLGSSIKYVLQIITIMKRLNMAQGSNQ